MKKILLNITLVLTLVTISSCKSENKEIPLTTYQQWHTITIPFEGPETSENAVDNPFLNYRLNVVFKHEQTQYEIHGFYAADGNASETSADKGNIWQVRFTPDKIGKWTYSAALYRGDGIALVDDKSKKELIPISNSEGEFKVNASTKEGVDFRSIGRLESSGGYFRCVDSGDYWLKGGADSPENFLAYDDFDGTYRMNLASREGEAKTTERVHTFEPHLKDWQEGDPIWQNGKGKGIIGALNYLSSKGMNVVYFLTLNILGDGKDVWPYANPDDFTRFDVSKLDQWEIVFQHMQAKGIMLHMVLQETENETMLDKGDTGPLRQLYIQELIARFGHHNALKFNLGEENGHAEFTPNAQNDKQRRDMTSFIKKTDPYNHPIVLHTHSFEPARSLVLDSIYGFKNLDGLSLQVNKRKEAAMVMESVKKKAADAGHDWMVTMDEIGEWHTGALPDSEDPNHDTLRKYVLWGTLMSGAAGVEWYFGANNMHNDLTAENWRTRDRLWELTNHALTFFTNHLPFWEMLPEHGLINSKEAYCLRKKGEVYAIYLPDANQYSIDLRGTTGEFSVQWYNPLLGGELQFGSIKTISGGNVQELGNPPSVTTKFENQDWVVLLRRKQ